MAVSSPEPQKVVLLPSCVRKAFYIVLSFLRKIAFWILSAGPLPRHLAIIMDGNRRFADRANLDRKTGHLHGYDRLVDTLDMCHELGIEVLTVYAFSIDNFRREEREVQALMELLQKKLDELAAKGGLAEEKGLHVRLLGDLSLLPNSVRVSADRAMAVTERHSSAVLNICAPYTSREEIVQAFSKLRDSAVEDMVEKKREVEWVKHNREALNSVSDFSVNKPVDDSCEDRNFSLLNPILVSSIDKHLYTSHCPPVDLLIRTSGETRLSNFLLWQVSHAHLCFCKVLWPDFSFRHLVWALLEYQLAWPHILRQRKVFEQASLEAVR